tara:strand:- start:120 stop:359 length:240 start_codon:yes stop_codon:yes gene_type:complete
MFFLPKRAAAIISRIDTVFEINQLTIYLRLIDVSLLQLVVNLQQGGFWSVMALSPFSFVVIPIVNRQLTCQISHLCQKI